MGVVNERPPAGSCWSCRAAVSRLLLDGDEKKLRVTGGGIFGPPSFTRVKGHDVNRAHDDDRDVCAFRVSERAAGGTGRGLVGDCGATSHIVTGLAELKRFDERFQAKTRCVELCVGVAERRGDAGACLIDSRGRHLNVTRRQALYIPSFSQDIFSVTAATASGAAAIFKEGKNRDGTRFHVHLQDRLFYLHTSCMKPLNMLQSDSTVVSCSATAPPASTGTLHVPPPHVCFSQYNTVSVTNTKRTVAVTTTAVLSGFCGNSTQVRCAVRVLSVQKEVFPMIPGLKHTSADAE
ncbi:uncharacterized protein [Trachinotus anak]|uniref:uncharacterized protein n=1 Tax=Trachinotus anak TaxID=443729 RepID=UPI0039F2551E